MTSSIIAARRMYQNIGFRAGLHICVLILSFALMLVSTGCSSKAPTVSFKVKSKKIVNDGQPVYLLVRTISGSEFVTDDYDAIATLFHAYPTDESIV